MEKEQWKDIPGYEGLYKISSLGRVKSLERRANWSFYNKPCSRNHKERVLIAEVSKIGYLRISLCKDGKRKRYHLHRIIAQAFIDNPSNLPIINHKNGIKTDNRLENLEWVSYSKNNYHAWRVLKKKAYNSKRVMCIETGEIFETITQAALKYGKNKVSLWNCIKKGANATFCKKHWQVVNS